MATHPFAIKLERAILDAERVRDALIAAKSAAKDADKPEGQWWDWIDSSGRKRIITRIFGRKDLGALAAGDASRVAFAEPGEAATPVDKKALARDADQELARLNVLYAEELAKCSREREVATANGSQILEDGSRVAAPRKENVQIPCPGAKRYADAIAAYVSRQSGGKRITTGGGGGGGW